MTGKEHFYEIIQHKSKHSGFWHGDPNPASIKKIYTHFDVKNDIDLGLKLGSICRWVLPDKCNYWKNPDMPMWDVLDGAERTSLSQNGVFAETESVAEVEAFHWPNVKDVDFTETLEEIDKTIAAGQAVLSGAWAGFFHNVCDFFGMESYFMKMHTDPEVVDAVTNHVVDFYLEINEMLFKQAGNKIDAMFFGNDFGSQRDLLISPESFDRFVMPGFVKFTEQAHRYGYKVVLHSCGSIYRVIPRLIDAGVEVLHPIQALAKNMDAEYLSKNFNGRIIFMGGVDTQQLLPFGTPQQVRDRVRQLRDLFGPNYIVSPSHESLLPNVSMENIEAMVEAARE
ncbi:uroporphyrinogen decarboxylase family protein [Treponema primitia]|uniref:uroporphyrinogen decarboxylase family protein n=1 Tax=Treponema primitia TaxID=88058 RepID=UPI00025550EE|nr:uroporphyrinogen decarboxylase family protein [Treponema primitia]